jgi:hypothetical protein
MKQTGWNTAYFESMQHRLTNANCESHIFMRFLATDKYGLFVERKAFEERENHDF